eukprot:Filipodium_phascolosomae@DN6326_c0_g1_i1.p1
MKRRDGIAVNNCVVEFGSAYEAKMALQDTTPKYIGGRHIQVLKFDEESKGERKPKPWGRPEPFKDTDGRGVFISHSELVTEKDLRQHLEANGFTANDLSRVIPGKRYTLVNFKEPNLAKSAIVKLNNSILNEQMVLVCPVNKTLR